MFVLSSKIRALKSIINKWNQDIHNNIHLKVTQAIDEVNTIQSLINDAGYNDHLGLKENA